MLDTLGKGILLVADLSLRVPPLNILSGVLHCALAFPKCSLALSTEH